MRCKKIFLFFNELAFFCYLWPKFQCKMSHPRLIITVPVCCLLLTASCGGERRSPVSSSRYSAVDTLPMLIMQVQKCARLYTAEYHVHKIVTHDDVLRVQGSLLKQDFSIKLPLGDRKIAIPMDATLKAYIDFSSFSEKNVERNGERITIVLPDPKVVMTSSKIDQHSIREYVDVARAHFSDAEVTGYEQRGRQAIIESIPQLGIVETAKESAARVLVPMFTDMGYKEENITIAFRKDFKTDRLWLRSIETPQ